MKKIVMLLVLGVIMSFSLAGCGGKTVAVTEEMNGQTITLEKGQTLSFTLAGNPTTGYTWEISEVDENILASAGEPDYSSDSNLIGSGGVYTYKFTAETAGTTALKLKYYRSFEPDVEPIQTFEINVVVE
jgi:inhibitor of cysteine peptidase